MPYCMTVIFTIVLEFPVNCMHAPHGPARVHRHALTGGRARGMHGDAAARVTRHDGAHAQDGHRSALVALCARPAGLFPLVEVHGRGAHRLVATLGAW